MKRIILTMLDDNNTIWYEQLVPFLLSLKATDFNGDIGVISYGLSESKQRVLENFGCKVFPALNQYPELLIDRQVTGAEIAERYDYDQLAMFDADIWFPHAHFSLFEHLTEHDKLYCTHDIWKCGFLFSCLQGESSEQIAEKIHAVEQTYGHVWQAGMISGHRNAWKKYRTYVEQQLAQCDAFKMEYGVDTTLLNLYSADENGITYISRKYNCLPAWGIRQENRGYGIQFMIENEPVEALHVSRAHRKGGEFSYQQLFKENYFQQGQMLQIKDYPHYHIAKESLCDNTPIDNLLILTLEHAETNGCMIIRTDRTGEHYKQNSVLIETAGYSTLRFYNQYSTTQQLVFYFQPVLNFTLCEEVYLQTQQERFLLEANKRTAYHLETGQWLEFQVRELNIDGKRLRWVFEDLKLIA